MNRQIIKIITILKTFCVLSIDGCRLLAAKAITSARPFRHLLHNTRHYCYHTPHCVKYGSYYYIGDCTKTREEPAKCKPHSKL